MNISAKDGAPLFPTDEGILAHGMDGRHMRVERFAPPPSLAPYVDHLWVVDWAFAPGVAIAFDIVAMPCVNLVLAPEGAFFAGVKTERQSYHLDRAGRIAGIRFKPAGFHPFLGSPVAKIRNTEIPAQSFHPSLDTQWALVCLQQASPQACSALAFERIGALPPGHKGKVDLVERILRACWEQPDLPITAIASHFALSVRTLELLFHDHVGVSLVWIRRQIRAIAAMRLGGGDAGWADIAQQLGYSDQAHLINQFRQAVGVPPGEFFRRMRKGRG